MPSDVDTSIDGGWSYHQNRGRGEWFFTIEPKDVVKYNYEGKISFLRAAHRWKLGALEGYTKILT